MGASPFQVPANARIRVPTRPSRSTHSLRTKRATLGQAASPREKEFFKDFFSWFEVLVPRCGTGMIRGSSEFGPPARPSPQPPRASPPISPQAASNVGCSLETSHKGCPACQERANATERRVVGCRLRLLAALVLASLGDRESSKAPSGQVSIAGDLMCQCLKSTQRAIPVAAIHPPASPAIGRLCRVLCMQADEQSERGQGW